METAISALIVIGIMILAISGISGRALSAQASLGDAMQVAQARMSEQARTAIAPIGAVSDANGETVQFTVKNTGTTLLADFFHWDVIIEYADGMTEQVKWMPYGTDANKWSAQIYQDAGTGALETFDPDLLNPGEDLVISVNVSPPLTEGSTNRITVVTPNGVVAATTFTH